MTRADAQRLTLVANVAPCFEMQRVGRACAAVPAIEIEFEAVLRYFGKVCTIYIRYIMIPRDHHAVQYRIIHNDVTATEQRSRVPNY